MPPRTSGRPFPLQAERSAGIAVHHLTAPGGDRPGVGMPLRNRWQQRCAGLGLGCRQRGGRWGLEVEIAFAAIKVDHPIDVLDRADAFAEAVPEAAGLQILLTALKTQAPGGEQGAAVGLELQPVGQQATTGQIDHDVAGGHESLGLGVVVLMVGAEDELLGQEASDRGIRQVPAQRLPRRRGHLCRKGLVCRDGRGCPWGGDSGAGGQRRRRVGRERLVARGLCLSRCGQQQHGEHRRCQGGLGEPEAQPPELGRQPGSQRLARP